MGRLARSGRHFRNRPGRRPQHMTPYKRVIYPVDGFSSPCVYFIMQGIKTATRGAWRVMKCRFSRTPFITPSGRHCITLYRKLSSVFCNRYIYFII